MPMTSIFFTPQQPDSNSLFEGHKKIRYKRRRPPSKRHAQHVQRQHSVIFLGPCMMPFLTPTVRAIAALSVTQLIGWGATFWLPAVTGSAMAGELAMALPLVRAGPPVMLVIMAKIGRA